MVALRQALEFKHVSTHVAFKFFFPSSVYSLLLVPDPEGTQYSYNAAGNVDPGTEVTCDTNVGTFARGTFTLGD